MKDELLILFCQWSLKLMASFSDHIIIPSSTVAYNFTHGNDQIWLFVLMLDVEPQYSGARIEGDVVTLDFVKKMMEDFKNQKFLHKRY